jgi:plasmid maintenance system antidote protein VapI
MPGGGPKLTREQVDLIRYLHTQSGWTTAVLARRYQVDPSNIRNIIRNQTWHDPDYTPPPPPPVSPGEKRLTAETATEIRKRFKAGGISQRKLAQEYGVAQSNISAVIRNKQWYDPAYKPPKTTRSGVQLPTPRRKRTTQPDPSPLTIND